MPIDVGCPQGQFTFVLRKSFITASIGISEGSGVHPRLSMTSDDVSEPPISLFPHQGYLAPCSLHLILPDLVGFGPQNWPPLHGSWEAWEPSSAGLRPPTTLSCHTPKAGTWYHQPLEPSGTVVIAVTRAASQETPGVVEFWMTVRVHTSYLLSI